jgi:hypothetical protein
MAVLAYQYGTLKFQGFNYLRRGAVALCACRFVPVNLHQVLVAVGADCIAYQGIMDTGYVLVAVGA